MRCGLVGGRGCRNGGILRSGERERRNIKVRKRASFKIRRKSHNECGNAF